MVNIMALFSFNFSPYHHRYFAFSFFLSWHYLWLYLCPSILFFWTSIIFIFLLPFISLSTIYIIIYLSSLSNKYSSMLPWLSHSHSCSSICLCIAFMPHGKTLHFPTNSLLISCYFSILLSFLHILIHSLHLLPQFIYSLIRITIFFFIQNVKANTVYLQCDYNENDLNTHEQEWISKKLHTVQFLW